MTYRGVGELIGTTFIPRANIDNDTRGAIEFSVKNIGTKTSERWTYQVELPNGQTFTSGIQDRLKPNEEAVLTLGFSLSDTGSQKFSGSIDIDGDINTRNNDFEWSVNVTN
jgi:hypothetical protein